MDFLRTPDDRFAAIADYPYDPKYLDVDAGDGSGTPRMAYVDEGPADAPVVLMLHGEPSWGFLYRHVMGPVLAAGHRCVVPDLIGFGRSDKPADRNECTYARHYGWVRSLVHQLDLRDITLVCQDWGGLLGLRMVGLEPERFAGVVAANTFLPTGDGTPSEAFRNWRQFSQDVPEFPTGMILQGATVSDLPAEVVAAYDAPFPDESYKEAARQFPVLVPIDTDDPGGRDNVAAWEGLAAFDRPFVTAFSDGDPVTAGNDVPLQQRIAGAAGQPHVTLAGGGHFLQEDVGPELGQVVVDLLARSAGA